MLRAIVILATILISGLVIGQAQPVAAHITVPFVGCAADGQVGAHKAPEDGSKEIAIPASAASRLAWYEGPGEIGSFGVLGPRGWHCFETYGPNGATLYLSPQPLSSKELIFHKDWKGFDGPAIQISDIDGGTSGRFEVARTIARVFPAHIDFTRRVIAEGLEPASDFPTGPYPGDKLTYRSADVLEFETPANTDGLGTMSFLLKNNSSIRGVAILVGEDTSLLQLSARLPANSTRLTRIIIQEAERDAAKLTN